ncbi:hypothetical protein ACLKA7_000953 [Drosophila subpalustris]
MANSNVIITVATAAVPSAYGSTCSTTAVGHYSMDAHWRRLCIRQPIHGSSSSNININKQKKKKQSSVAGRQLYGVSATETGSSVLALAGHPSILSAEGFSHQSLLWQDIHRSLLPLDPVISPCSGRTSINPCCRGIQSSVLAVAGHPSILAAEGFSHQSLLWQDIHRSLLPRDPVISPCSGRTSIDPCCRGIQSSVLALAGHPSILAAEGFSHQSLLWQDIHRSLLPRDPVNSPFSGRTSIDPCCRGIQSTVLALAGQSSILVATGSEPLILAAAG